MMAVQSTSTAGQALTPPSIPNYFSLPDLDRITEARADAVWVSQQLEHPDTTLVPVWRDQNLFTRASELAPAFVPAVQVPSSDLAAACIVLLGRMRSRLYFAVGLDSAKDAPPAWAANHGVFRDLRQCAPLIGHRESAILSYARAMIYWHRRHRFCGDCGAPTLSSDAGHTRVCTDPACSQQHFPRTDPAVITAVTSRGRCLFGRKSAWPNGMYSIIAGFVEPGESLEAAVYREVLEETGIHVGNITYRSSQPWPFPSSLMLGFTATATSDTISLTDGELEDARWMSRTDVVQGIRAGSFRLPTPTSISYRLISEWYDGGQPGSLSQALKSVSSGD
jgi:NAD+ diphosphatase